MYAWDSCVYLECVWMMCISLHYFISLASSSNGVLFVNPPLQCFGRSSIAIFVGPESCNRGLTKVLQRCFGHFWPVCTFIHTLALQYMLCTLFATYRPLPPALCRESNASGLRSLAWCGAHVWNCWMIVENRKIGIRNKIRIGNGIRMGIQIGIRKIIGDKKSPGEISPSIKSAV